MGIVSSKDTRRVSFDNTLSLTPMLDMSKSIQDNIDQIEDLESDTQNELLFKDSKTPDSLGEGDGDYWANRIESLMKEHQSINKIIETEYEKTIKTTNNTFESPKITNDKLQKIKPCFDWRTKIMKCYEENPHQPLVCSTLVQAFSQCVSNCRVED